MKTSKSVGLLATVALVLSQLGVASASCTSARTTGNFASCSGGGESGQISRSGTTFTADLAVGSPSALGRLFDANNSQVFCNGGGAVTTPRDLSPGLGVRSADATKVCPLAVFMEVRIN